MRLVTKKINAEVKSKKVSAENLVPRPVILRKHNGMTVEKKRFTSDGKELTRDGKRPSFHYEYVREDGVKVPKNEVQYFQILEDGEKQVSKFKRTKEIKIVKEVPAASVDNFLVASVYELFHTDEDEVAKLYEEAERYFKEDLAGICLFSWGNGFLQYYGIVAPVMKDGKFVWVMKLTQTKVQYQHLMEVPKQKTPVKQPPTLDTLPPVEAMITV
jgi:hypothetical protein